MTIASEGRETWAALWVTRLRLGFSFAVWFCGVRASVLCGAGLCGGLVRGEETSRRSRFKNSSCLDERVFGDRREAGLEAKRMLKAFGLLGSFHADLKQMCLELVKERRRKSARAPTLM